MGDNILARIYTLSIGSSPILSFEAQGLMDARQLSKERWLIEELRGSTREGSPIWPADAKLSIARATSTQEEIYRISTVGKPPTDEIDLVYLVAVDNPMGNGS